MEITHQKIRHILERYLSDDVALRCERTANLRTLGLASMQFISLILDLEQEFAVDIPSRMMVPSNFETIEAIESTLAALPPAQSEI
jgi:acyl carrier protein